MKYWYKIHRWVSLICAIFFLLLCITGLPLLFKNEIHDWNLLKKNSVSTPTPYDVLWESAGKGKLAVESNYPEKSIKSISSQAEMGELLFRVQNKNSHEIVASRLSMGGEQIAYNVKTGTLHGMNMEHVKYPFISKFMHWMHILHMRMGLGTGGMIFLAFMCFLSMVSIISGIFIYQPFMKNISFGTLRRNNKRMLWMDWHKFTGIVAGVWATILCFSGLMIVVFSLSYGAYISDSKAEAEKNLPIIHQSSTSISIQQAITFINKSFPNQVILSIDLPEKITEKTHYTFYVTQKKDKPTEYLGQLVFLPSSIQNQESFFTKSLPWYFPFVSFALDLHIHNHETLFLKIVWAIFVLVTIIMIISGIYAWVFRHLEIPYRQKDKPFPKENIQIKKNIIWRMPVFIALFSIFGLVAPLYNEFWQNIGLLALLMPIFILGICWYRSHHNR